MRLTLENVSSKTFRPFDKNDWMGYAGCESKMPLICSEDDGDYIIDGDWVSWYGVDGDYEEMMKINDLPHEPV